MRVVRESEIDVRNVVVKGADDCNDEGNENNTGNK